MFYTKYRPQNFSEIVATSSAPKALSKQISTGKNVHAYLFVGPRGIGKTTTARVLAKALNCSNLSKEGNPCGKCVSCKAIQSGSFLDLTEIDAASNRGIDDIRDLKSKVGLAPAHGKNKVYIIDEVHMLTKEAFNALLKTLEEPPEKVTFILCTTEANKVPDTIKSRCQTYKFKRASIPQLVDSLERIASSEGFEIDSKDLEKIASASLGGFRDAITLLQQVVEGDLDVSSFSGLDGVSGYLTFVGHLINKDKKAALEVVREVFDDGSDLYIWTGELLKYIRDLMFIKSGAESLASVNTTEIQNKMNMQAKSIEIGWVLFVLDEFITAQESIRDAFIPQIALEIAIIKVCEGLTISDNNIGPNNTRGDQNEISDQPKNRVSNLDSSFTNKNKEPPKEEIKIANLKKAVVVEVSSDCVIELEEVEEKWKSFISEMRKINHSLLTLIKNTKPIGVEGNVVVLEVGYTFHKERMETAKNRKMIEQALQTCYGRNITIRCEISDNRAKELSSSGSSTLTDLNIMVPSESVVIDKDAIIEAFDGGLPIV